MADLTRAKELLEELRDRLDQLETELARQEAGGALPAQRAALPNIIPPTQTDDPDSIVGGRRTRPSDFQDCCAVGNDAQYFCTGTLIAPNLVVTAKHCPEALPITRVFLKGVDIQRPNRGETIRVAEVFMHPDRNVDLAVLLLEKASEEVTHRHVAQGDEAEGAAEAMLVGFGTIDLSGTVGYGIKRQVKVPIASLDCGSAADRLRYGCRQGIEIVAGHRGLLRDSCRGDSGGPLYVKGKGGEYYLLGATSRGSNDSNHMCGDGGVYVRVDKFLDWIQKETGVQIDGPKDAS